MAVSAVFHSSLPGPRAVSQPDSSPSTNFLDFLLGEQESPDSDAESTVFEPSGSDEKPLIKGGFDSFSSDLEPKKDFKIDSIIYTAKVDTTSDKSTIPVDERAFVNNLPLHSIMIDAIVYNDLPRELSINNVDDANILDEKPEIDVQSNLDDVKIEEFNLDEPNVDEVNLEVIQPSIVVPYVVSNFINYNDVSSVEQNSFVDSSQLLVKSEITSKSPDGDYLLPSLKHDHTENVVYLTQNLTLPKPELNSEIRSFQGYLSGSSSVFDNMEFDAKPLDTIQISGLHDLKNDEQNITFGIQDFGKNAIISEGITKKLRLSSEDLHQISYAKETPVDLYNNFYEFAVNQEKSIAEQSVLDQVANIIQTNKIDENGMFFSIEPEGMGELLIKLQIENNSSYIEILSDSEEVIRLLESGSSVLESAIESVGFDVDSVVFAVDDIDSFLKRKTRSNSRPIYVQNVPANSDLDVFL